MLTLPLALIVAPRANNAWVRAMTGSVLGRVQLKVRPLEFNETLPNTVLLVREVDRDDRWRDVFAYMTDDPANPRLVLARSGTIRLFPEQRRAVLELEDGVVYAGPSTDPDKDTLTTFDRLEEEIDVEDLFPPHFERQAGPGEGHRRARPGPRRPGDRRARPPRRPAGPGPSDRDPQEDSPCPPPASSWPSSACRSAS